MIAFPWPWYLAVLPPWPMGCVTCFKPKATLSCGICNEAVCKSCAQFVDEDAFSFLAHIPEQLKHQVFCGPCFNQNVAEELASYEQTMAQAKNTLVYEKTQGKETRLIKRLEEPVKVVDCPDREEAVLRLAFFAAKLGYNSIIDVEVSYKKVGERAYQKLIYSASGIPAHVTADRLVKDRAIWQNPN